MEIDSIKNVCIVANTPDFKYNFTGLPNDVPDEIIIRQMRVMLDPSDLPVGVVDIYLWSNLIDGYLGSVLCKNFSGMKNTNPLTYSTLSAGELNYPYNFKIKKSVNGEYDFQLRTQGGGITLIPYTKYANTTIHMDLIYYKK